MTTHDFWAAITLALILGYGTLVAVCFTREIIAAVWRRWRS